jgi:thiol-disulfide isomerase/thioredoxin
MNATPARRAVGETVAVGLRVALTFALPIALILTLSAAPRVFAEDAHANLRGFAPTGKYILDARPAAPTPPSVYWSARAGCYLVRGSALGEPILILTRDGRVDALTEDGLIFHTDGTCDVRADAQPHTLGPCSIQGAEIVFSLPGLTGRLTAPPPLLGWHSSQDVVRVKPEYWRDAQKYQPDAPEVDAIRRLESKIQVFVYFGTWCHTCQSMMGRVLKLEQALTTGGRHNVEFAFYGLPPPPEMWDDPEVKLRVIKSLPTGIVYVNDKYAGGIVSTAWADPEGAMLQLLTAVKAH